MTWWLEENSKLMRENKKLKEENAELKEKLGFRNEDTILLDIVNAFLVSNKLIDDLNKYIHSHSMDEVYRSKDEIRELWKKL